jgi:hypothetical protein
LTLSHFLLDFILIFAYYLWNNIISLLTQKWEAQVKLLGVLAVAILALSILSGTLYAQAPDTVWTKTFGGAYTEEGRCVQQTTDGGYILVGFTDSYGAGSEDVWLIKTDSAGNESWSKTFGGAQSDQGMVVHQTSDGGYIILGGTGSYGVGLSDIWLIKTDGAGDTVCTKTFGGTDYDVGYCIQKTADQGYIITGETSSYGAGSYDVWLIKTDSAGNESWNSTFGGNSADYGRSVQQTSDGGYIIAGQTLSFGAGSYDVWLIKTDSAGNESWSKTYGDAEYDAGYSVQQTTDGGYILVGFTDSYGAGSADVWLIKTDSAGNESWNKTFGGTDFDLGLDVQLMGDGGYIIAAGTQSYGAGGDDGWIIKTDSAGNESWNKTLGGSDNDYTESVQQTTDGGYIIVGSTETFISEEGGDIYLIKLEAETGVENDGATVIKNDSPTSTIFSGALHLPKERDCKVYSITGRKVNPHSITPGIYFIEIDGKIKQKVVKVR